MDEADLPASVILRRMAQDALEDFVSNMTLADLATRSGRSVAEIVDYAMRTKPTPSNGTTSKAKPTLAKAKSRKAVNTRTPAGRDQYDAAVLQVLRDAGDKVGAVAVRKQVGGTALQVRTALNRLIEAGSVAFEGKARATTYSTT